MRFAHFYLLVGLLLAVSPFEVKYVNIGQSITLPCSGEPDRVVEWHFKQPVLPDWLLVAKLHTGPISPGPGFQGRVESVCEEQPGNYSLVLSPVMYDDLGIYECRDKHGSILSDVKLHISDPVSVSIAVGMSASLPCYGGISKRARAVDLDILWKRDGKMVYQLYNNTITYGPGFESRASVSPEQALHGNLSLTIKQTRFSDQGHYQCFYSSPKESGNPDSARLHVTDPPPQILTVKAGEELSVLLRTTDPVRVTFTGPGLDEVLMVDANEGPVTYGEQCGQRCEVLGQENTFLLRRVTLEDAGVYTVTDSETVISIVCLHVSGLPPSEEGTVERHSGGQVTKFSTVALVITGMVAVVMLMVIALFHQSLCNQDKNIKSYQAAREADRETQPIPEATAFPVSETEPSEAFVKCESS
ncbi:hypothetical protein COCON_G00101020 [Conger conger]|uniref:Ig-like domain-containing protein n=1 Tax=Conger conger TaxID=82655 RepID=A0A9Q1HYI1_CONCO|nr:hypothetical protein COCON_G00101020 [Conger conger]